MLSKNQIKYLHSFRLGKFRNLHQAFLVEGVKMVDELLQSSYIIQSVYGLGTWYESRKKQIDEKRIEFREISEDELRKVSGMVSPNEVIALAAMPSGTAPQDDELGNLVLLLDHIQDPGNLGTIIRTADWFGIRNIICSPGTVDVYNPKVIQATMGSIFRVNIIYRELGNFIRSALLSRKIYAATAAGENIQTVPLELPAALIIGNESNGISDEVLCLATHKTGIPAFSATVESLNASVAAGIICWEFIRRA